MFFCFLSIFQLPSEVQAKVRTYAAQKRCSTDVMPSDVKSITVPISTFPPTAMVYNITKPTDEKHSDDDSDESKPPVDVVSAAIMAKVLEDREKERIFAKHCETCTCHRSILTVDAEAQTCVPDAQFSSERMCNNENQTSEVLNDEKSQSKGKLQNSTTNTIFYEINENIANDDKIQHHTNRDSAKYISQASSIKEKHVNKNNRNVEQNCINMKTSIAKTNSVTKINSFQNYEKEIVSEFPRLNDFHWLNADKVKPLKDSKKCESPTDRSTMKHWNKCERNSCEHSGTGPVHSENRFSGKQQTQIDIINDRLWKNEWTKFKSEINERDDRRKNKINSDVELNIINNRDWTNDRSERQEMRNAPQLTLIEIKNLDNTVNQNDSSQTEATSPSFSSDSIVICSSDPSSSSSDVTQSLMNGHAFNNVKSSNQNRVTGPRNCLVRVTPGSKNILLDNVGHYKTTMYSSSGSKGSTALVHTKKMSRAGSERSTSTSNEDNSSVLLQENNQLQRVAEWVQSSLCAVTSHDSNKTKCRESDSSLMYLNDSLMKSLNQDNDLSCNLRDSKEKTLKNLENYRKDLSNKSTNISSTSGIANTEQDKSEDLITFEVLKEELPNEESLKGELSKEKLSKEELTKDSRKSDLHYDVKITKEMEEAYLKLAASLSPVTLSLSNSNNTELTIEKYRQDYKRLQRIQDQAFDRKAGSKI